MIMEIRSVQFCNWINSNYEGLKNEIKHSYFLDEDVLHDVLLNIHENILISDFNMADVKCFVIDKYKKAYCQKLSNDKKYLNCEDGKIDAISFHKNKSVSSRENYDQISKSIVKKVKDLLSMDDFNLFSLYITNDSLSIKQMSAYTGIPSSTLYGRLKNIKKTIINQLKSTTWN